MTAARMDIEGVSVSPGHHIGGRRYEGEGKDAHWSVKAFAVAVNKQAASPNDPVEHAFLIQSRQTLRISISPQPKARALPRPAPSVARNVSGSSTDRIPLTSSKPNVTRLFPGLESWRTE